MRNGEAALREATFSCCPQLQKAPEAVTYPDFSHLDSWEDRIREAVFHGGDVADMLNHFAEEKRTEHQLDAIRSVFARCSQASDRVLGFEQVCWACGISATQGKTSVDLARERGVSKQAFEQGAERIMAGLNLHPAITRRSAEAKRNMRMKGYRRASGTHCKK